jgi:hypothetical protein
MIVCHPRYCCQTPHKSPFKGFERTFKGSERTFKGSERTFKGFEQRFIKCKDTIKKGLMQIFNAISAKNLLIQDFYFLYG